MSYSFDKPTYFVFVHATMMIDEPYVVFVHASQQYGSLKEK